MNRVYKNGFYLIFAFFVLVLIQPLACAFSKVEDKSLISAQKIGKIELILREEIEENNIPALAVGVLKKDRLIWSKGYGWVNQARNKKVTPDTPFMLASISKTITFTAALQLYEQGKLNLDLPISTYLPFKVIHPHYPETPITLRMMMTHTTGIADADAADEDYYVWGKDSDIPLGNLMKSYFSKGGKDYDEDDNFHRFKPGTREEYSNMATALAGYLVEHVSHQPFNVYCNQHIFKPLQMNRTRWFLKELNQSEIARPHNLKGKALNHYSFADYPDGQLRSSINDLSRFFATIMGNGSYQGVKILSSQTNQQMKKKQMKVSDFGLGVYYTKINGRTYLGHDGSEKGVSTEMWYNPQTEVGVILLANIEDLDLSDALDKIAQIVR